MANKDLTVILPVEESTKSAEVAAVTKTTVASGDKITIKKALENKNNSMVIIVDATTGGTLAIKAGDNYPNAILGDLTVAATQGTTAIMLQDISRFENRDNSVVIEAAFAGTIYAVAKRAGLKEV